MHRLLHVLLAIVAMLAAAPSMAQKRSPTVPVLQAYLDDFARKGPINGVILVAKNGRIVARGAYGLANRTLNVPVTRDTRFEIASITKTFTALMILRLVDRGLIRLDATVGEYLPKLPAEWRDKVTIRQLLEHRGGVQGDIGDFPTSGHDFPPIVAQINGDFFGLDDLTAMIAKRPLLFAPGSDYSYSSDGYVLLGAVAAAVTRRDYASALGDSIVSPAGLSHTGYAPQTEIVPMLASGYRQTWDGYENARRLNASPAGGLYATADDLLAWTRAIRDGRIMSATSKQLAWRLNANITQYGWKRAPDAGANGDAMLVQASGALPGANALVTMTLSDGITVIILTNTREMTFRLDEVTTGAIAIVRGRRAAPPRSSAARALAGLAPGKLPYGIKTFGTIAQNEAAGRYVGEAELNAFGYHLMARGDDAAVAVLELNTRLFSRSGNAFDSLGEAYAKAGRTDEAIAAYRESLRLDPANRNAATMIERLRR